MMMSFQNIFTNKVISVSSLLFFGHEGHICRFAVCVLPELLTTLVDQAIT